MGLTESLIDAEGYPRSDIDVYQVRHARHQIKCECLGAAIHSPPACCGHAYIILVLLYSDYYYIAFDYE